MLFGGFTLGFGVESGGFWGLIEGDLKGFGLGIPRILFLLIFLM